MWLNILMKYCKCGTIGSFSQNLADKQSEANPKVFRLQFILLFFEKPAPVLHVPLRPLDGLQQPGLTFHARYYIL